MARGRVSLMVVGVMSLAAVGLVMLGPRSVQGLLPDPVVAFLARFGAFDGVPTGAARGNGATAADNQHDAGNALPTGEPVAAGPGNAPVVIRDVITGYTTRVSDDVPAEITTIRPILGCRLTPPNPGSIIGHVLAGRSGMQTALATYNDTHLAQAVQDFVAVYRKTGASDPSQAIAPAYEAYDVAVTETAAPVYLVLESQTGNRIWNIHLVEGARVERVVLLGGDQAGVANLDPVVPVEVLLGAGLAECGIAPAYALDEGYAPQPSAQASETDQRLGEQERLAISEAASRYDIWFRDTFGVKANDSRIGHASGTLSVVGPVPAAGQAKASYVALRGAKVRATRDVFLEIKGQVARGEEFPARVVAIATTFAFGDLRTLMQGVEF